MDRSSDGRVRRVGLRPVHGLNHKGVNQKREDGGRVRLGRVL